MAQISPILQKWCASVLGEFEFVSDHSREHAGERAAAHQLRAAQNCFYLKVHRDAAHWESELHAYERWAPAFGGFAPRLVAARPEPPLALLMTALPGRVLESTAQVLALPPAEERGVWQAAGQALASLHALPAGPFFGPCRRDGSTAGVVFHEAVQYVTHDLEELLERGERIRCLTQAEQHLVRRARALIPAFAGEQPVACHRDYCPANWLVMQTRQGWQWTGVIDFEFSRWDVRAVDYTRYPNFEWIRRSDLTEAFFEGYGRTFTPAEEQQRLFCHLLYALGALVWGMENEYFIFAAEGRDALKHLESQIG